MRFFLQLFSCLALSLAQRPKIVLAFSEKWFIMVTYKIKKVKIIMTRKEKIARLQTQLNEWTARLNKSRKNSLRAMRAMHVNHIQKELDALKQPYVQAYAQRYVQRYVQCLCIVLRASALSPVIERAGGWRRGPRPASPVIERAAAYCVLINAYILPHEKK